MADRAVVTLARLAAHDRRLAQLSARPMAQMSQAERSEVQRIEAARDQIWRRLPTRIAAMRRKLAQLEAYVDQIGMGPV